jgi:hypothetical protein
MTAVPPVPEVTVMIPLPLVGDGATEYVAWNAAPETGPLAAPMSSVPLILPVGVAPSAENSPENTPTPNAAGLAVKPAYVPFSALLLKEPAAWGSPNPNKTLASETNRKT